jgi:hypothetical protein
MRKNVIAVAVCLALALVAWTLVRKLVDKTIHPTVAESAHHSSAQPASAKSPNSHPAAVAAAERENASIPDVVPCREEASMQRTPVLVSATGARAYLQQSVAIVDRREQGMVCRVDWVLHIAKAGEAAFKAVHAHTYVEQGVTPDNIHSDASLYYSGRVLGWSGNARKLLAVVDVAQYEDWFQPYPLVYDSATGNVRSVDLQKLFASLAPEGCDLQYELQGFTADGKLLVSAEPFDYVDAKNCFPASLWTVDIAANHVQRAAVAPTAILERRPELQGEIE